MDNIKQGIASAIRNAISKGDLVSWPYEVTAITDLQTQVKVYPPGDLPPRYFVVQVKEGQ